MRRLFAGVVVVGCVVSLFGCEALNEMLDPTAGMTPAEREAYYAQKEEERQQREAEQAEKRAAFEARNIQDMTTPGEAHDEARAAEVVGRWRNTVEMKWESMILFDMKDGMRRWSYEMTFFENGSYAYRMTSDERWGEDSKGRDWEADYHNDLTGNTSIERGQWKTENGRLYTRPVAWGGYGGWIDRGAYGFQDGNRTLIVLDDKGAERSAAALKEDAPLWRVSQALTENTLTLKK